MKIIMIAAIGANLELGKNNKLIWHLPEDLKIFKEKTTDHIIVMGKKTFESLPKLLPNRRHVVLCKEDEKDNLPNEVMIFHNVKDIIDYFNDTGEDIYIIGGGQTYKAFLKYADIMYLTEIDRIDKEADTFFPKFNVEEWDREVIADFSNNEIPYKHVKYTRKECKI